MGGPFVSDQFNTLCIEMRVEARVQPLPNPGDPYRALLLITFKSFNDNVLKITQKNSKRQVHLLPVKGEIQVMVLPGEEMPDIERDENYAGLSV